MGGVRGRCIARCARRYGEQYELRELTLTEVDLSPRSDRSPADEAWNAAWGAKLGAVKALERKRLDPGDIDGKVHDRIASSR